MALANAVRSAGAHVRAGMGMDAASVRARLLLNFEYSGTDPVLAHSMYHDDAVLEFPQSGERFVGVENFSEWRAA